MSLQDLLNKRTGEVEAPKTLPMGTYLASVTSIGKLSAVGKENTDCMDFELTLLSPGEDVDPTELAELEKGVTGRKLRARFFITEDALFRLTEFFEKLDLPSDAKILENASNVLGRQIHVKIKHRTYQDGDQMRIAAEIGSYIKVA